MTNLFNTTLMQAAKDQGLSGKLQSPDKTCSQTNLSCGDSVIITFKLEQNKIDQAKFEYSGCLLGRAATVLLLKSLIGKTWSDATKFDEQNLLSLLQVQPGPNRMECVALPIKALAG